MNEDKATRYHRLRRRTSLLETAVGAAFLLLLVVTGGSALLRDWAAMPAGPTSVLTVVVYVLVVALLGEALQLPLAFYQGVILERRYELSTQSTGRWWSHRLRAFLVALPLVVAGAVVVWSLVSWNPGYWWLVAALCFALALVVLAQLAPVMLIPLFYRCEPLRRPALAERLAALAERAGTPVLGVFEWRVSDRTRKANAVLAGIGSTRRILLSDTLLAGHSDDEVEVILAHELSHHVHHDIWKALALEAVLILLGFYLADRTLDALTGHFGLAGKSDVAGLPVLVLAAGVVSAALLPLANAVSRAHERQADRFALEMTGNAAAFMSAMKRLAAQNLAEERPSRWVEILFYSHPPIGDRLEAARAWELWNGKAAQG